MPIGNWVDLIIFIFLVYFGSEAFRHGFWVILADFIAFFGSLIFSLTIYKYLAAVLSSNFSLSHGIANALGFLLVALITETFLGFLFGHLIAKVPERLWKNPLSRFLGILVGLGEGLILVAFLLVLLLALPISPTIKKNLVDSRIGGILVNKTSGLEATLTEIFGGAITDSLTYFTVKPGSYQSVPLATRIDKLVSDSATETAMFSLINKERRSHGVAELIWTPNLMLIAREHASDMWQRQYFSHYSLEGNDVGDRLTQAGIAYGFAGENLALAPTLATAHTGLMNSTGHRENILDPRFHKLGIGVIDNGYWGKMFVQIFTD